MKGFLFVRTGIALLALAGGGCARRAERAGAVTLALNWFPEVEHGGFYAALVHGYYAEEGLDVQILPGGPDAPVTARVATGRVTFGVENADHVVYARAEGADVVALLAPIQNSPRCLIVHAASPIHRFEDLRDVTLAMSAKGAFAHFLRARLPLEGVRVTPYTGSLSLFLRDPNYVQQGYVFSEPLLARRAGVETRALLVSDLGFNPYTSVLLTRGSLWREQPDLVRRFVRASRRGWEHYLREPEATNRLIHRLNPEMDMEVLAFGVEALRPLALTETAQREGFGALRKERWAALVAQMEELGLVPAGRVRPEEIFVAPEISAGR